MKRIIALTAIIIVALEACSQGQSTNQSANDGATAIASVADNMVLVSGGSFMMGSDFEPDGVPQHRVTLDDFYIGRHEVTQALWQEVMGNNPSQNRGDNLPVENVSWLDCMEFIKRLNELTGKQFRLPTEAEWEYACRGGSTGKGFAFKAGDSIDEIAWYAENSNEMTHPVATKAPNGLGIYDMVGNVEEWCSSRYSKTYFSTRPTTNPQGPTTGDTYSCRGGSFYCFAEQCFVWMNNGQYPECRRDDIGFRLAISKEQSER